VLLALAGGMPAPALAADHSKPKEGKEGVVEGPVFIKMSPITLPVVQGNKITKTVGLVLALELEKGKTEAEFEGSRLRVRDAIITELYAYVDEQSGADRILDVPAIKLRLQNAVDQVLGPSFVREVLVQQAYERPQK
jgi:hypothetical protein